jgi:two-component system LytT family response regulator
MRLRLVIADDERPARRYLLELLKADAGVEIVGEAESGEAAVAMIGAARPDVALLDLQMPELGGLDVVRRLDRRTMPLIAFVTAFDDYAIDAFELNAIDYLLKPVEQRRLAATLTRARERLASREAVDVRAAALTAALKSYELAPRKPYAERIPVRRRDEVVILPVRQIASVIAEGDLMHITTTTGESFTITHPMHALAARLDPRRFVRLGRGTLANVELITRVHPMPGGTSVVTLTTGQELHVSRIQSRVLRDTLLKL